MLNKGMGFVLDKKINVLVNLAIVSNNNITKPSYYAVNETRINRFIVILSVDHDIAH